MTLPTPLIAGPARPGNATSGIGVNALTLIQQASFPDAPDVGQLCALISDGLVRRFDGTTWILVGGGGSGTVVSVALSVPSIMTASGSPVTSSGTLGFTFNAVPAAEFLGGPASGSPAAPSFRAIVATDLPMATGATSGAAGTAGLPEVPTSGQQTLFLRGDNSWQAVPPAGVTSVGLSMPDVFSVANSPITGAGSFAVTLQTQPAGDVFAGPASGSAAAPTFRALVATDIPSLAASIITSGHLAPAVGGTGVDGSAAANGRLLIGTGTGFAIAAVTHGAGITTTVGAGTLQISGVPMVGASSGSAGTEGDVPQPLAGQQLLFLRGDGTWVAQAGGTVTSGSTVGTGHAVYDSPASSSSTLAFKSLAQGTNITISDDGNGTLTVSAAGGGGGSVTSVALSMPPEFSVALSPITTSGDFGVTLATQSAHTVWAGPASGSAAVPGFRALAVADIPALPASQITSGLLAPAIGGTGVDASVTADGTLLIGNGGGFSLATLVQGSGISITNSAGGITIAATGGGGGVSTVNSRAGAVVLVGTDLPVFVASGGSHAPGAVPDPGSSTGDTRFLCENAAFSIPPDFIGDSGAASSTGQVTPDLANNVTADNLTSATGTRPADAYLATTTHYVPNNATTGWGGQNTGVPQIQWIIDLQRLVTATGYTLKGHIHFGSDLSPTEWTFEGSIDGTTYTTLDHPVGASTEEVLYTGTVASPSPYQFYRFTFYAGAAGATSYNLIMSNFQILGYNGTGGSVAGYVPAPLSGDAAAGKVLGANGAWNIIPTFVGDGHYTLLSDTDVFLTGDDSLSAPINYGAGGPFTGTDLIAVPGKFGNAFFFSGPGSLITMPTASTTPVGLGGSLTVAFWVKTTSTTRMELFEYFNTSSGGVGEVFAFMGYTTPGRISFNGVSSPGVFMYLSSADAFETTTPYNDGAWHFVVIEKTSTTFSIWVDNVLNHTVSGITDVAIPASNCSFGNTHSGAGDQYVGNMDEMQVYDRQLTSGEKLQLFTSGFASLGSAPAAGLVPAPAPGDAFAGKILGAGGTWVAGAGSTNVPIYNIAFGDGLTPAGVTGDANITYAGNGIQLNNTYNLFWVTGSAHNASMGVDSGDSLNLYGTDSSGNPLQLFTIPMDTDTPAFAFQIPVTVNGILKVAGGSSYLLLPDQDGRDPGFRMYTSGSLKFYSEQASAVVASLTYQGNFTVAKVTATSGGGDNLTLSAPSGWVVIDSPVLYPSTDAATDIGIAGSQRFNNGYFAAVVEADAGFFGPFLAVLEQDLTGLTDISPTMADGGVVTVLSTAGACTCEPPSDMVNGQSMTITFTQPPSGGMATYTFSGIVFPNSLVPQVTQAANAVDVLSLTMAGGVIYGQLAHVTTGIVDTGGITVPGFPTIGVYSAGDLILGTPFEIGVEATSLRPVNANTDSGNVTQQWRSVWAYQSVIVGTVDDGVNAGQFAGTVVADGFTTREQHITATTTIAPTILGHGATISVVMSGTSTFAAPTMVNGQTAVVEFIQPASGGPYTITFSGITWPGGISPQLTQAANAIDTVYLRHINGVTYGELSPQTSPLAVNSVVFTDANGMLTTVQSTYTFTVPISFHDGISSQWNGVTDSEFYGSGAGNAGYTGAECVGVGVNALNAITSGSSNVGLGHLAGASIQNGFGNLAIGTQALKLVVGSNGNVGIGAYAGQVTTGGQNTFIGYTAGQNGTGTNNCVFIGAGAGIDVLTASNAIFIGVGAGGTVDHAGGNTVIGSSAGQNSLGVSNVAIGQGSSPTAAVVNTVSIGDSSGATGSGGIGIGRAAAPGVGQLIIGTVVNGNQITDFYPNSASTIESNIQSFTFHGMNASGADAAGGQLNIAAGTSTGLGAGGSLHLQTGSTGGSSGSSVNGLQDRLVIDTNGHSTFSGPVIVNNNVFEIIGTFASSMQAETISTNGFRWTLNNDGSYRLQTSTNAFGSSVTATPIYMTTAGRVVFGATVDNGIDQVQVTGSIIVTTQIQGAALLLSIVTKTSSYLLTTADYTVLMDTSSGPATATLPASPLTKQIVNIKLINSTNTLTISGNGHTIDGNATITASTLPYSLTLQFDGTAWWII